MTSRQCRIQELADVTWKSMRKHRIVPTPRNYEIWFSFCGGDKPRLAQRINASLQTGKSITAGMLDDWYREFCASPADFITVRDSASDLQQIAGTIVEHVTIDRGVLESFGQTVSMVSHDLNRTFSVVDLQQASATVSSATAKVNERLRAMEQLLNASILGISNLHERLTKAEKDATSDALTGLANRRSFDVMLAQATAQATAERSDLTLLMVDIDHFKRFNDTYGHILGDNVLRLVAHVLLSQIKGRDTAARYGGEEFAIILPGANLAGAVTIANQIRKALEGRPIVNRTSGQSFGVVTCSIGVGYYRHGEPMGELIERSDLALYDAKRSGRNAVRVEASQPAAVS